MSIEAMNWAYEQPITGWAKPILVMLADHADQNHEAWPSIARQACRVGCSERTIQSGLRELERGGYIRLDVGVGRGHVSRYQLQVRPRQCGAEKVRELHPSTIKGANPAPINGAGAAPFRAAKGANRVVKGANPALKGAGAAPEPLRTLREPKARARAREGQDFKIEENKREASLSYLRPDPEAPDPLDRPVDPARFRDLRRELDRSLQMKAYPPRAPILDAQQQQEVYAAAARPLAGPKFLPPEYLAVMRRAAGYGVPVA